MKESKLKRRHKVPKKKQRKTQRKKKARKTNGYGAALPGKKKFIFTGSLAAEPGIPSTIPEEKSKELEARLESLRDIIKERKRNRVRMQQLSKTFKSRTMAKYRTKAKKRAQEKKTPGQIRGGSKKRIK
jgi:hypothetical protein